MASKVTNAVGIAIRQNAIDAVLLNQDKETQQYHVVQSEFQPLDGGIFAHEGDVLADPQGLGEALAGVLKNLGATRIRDIHVSIPGTLLRMVDMPALGEKELYLSLSSEAEQYKSFDNTDSAVDFHKLGTGSDNLERLIFSAVRMDTLQGYTKAFQLAKIKPLTIDFEILNILRAMAGTGVLDSLVQQIGPDNYWGGIFVEPDRVRITLWKANEIQELREIHIDTRGYATAGETSFQIEDLFQEIRRTCKDRLPAIWMTHRLPPAFQQMLMQKLGVPFKECFLSPNFEMDRPDIDMAAVGAAFLK
jgi:Tfp pilus assembly PilM family ATPase